MPKQSFDILRFDSGTITNPSEQDIPPDSASYSENIDGSNEDGKLKGINTDSTKLLGSSFGDKLSEFALLSNGSQYDLVAYSKDNELRTVTDFYGTPTLDLNSGSQISDDNVTMQVTNQEVHVGMGSGSTHVTKWVGRIDSGQFDGSAPSGYQIDDAELKPPSQLPNFYKTVVIGSYLYGIEFEGKKIYKINKSTGAIESESEKTFSKLQAICVHDSSYIWVYDNDVNYGTVYKVAISTLTATIYSTIVDDSTLKSGDTITDLYKTDSYLWFWAYSDDTFTEADGLAAYSLIWNVALSSITNGSNITLISVMFPFTNTMGIAEGRLNTFNGIKTNKHAFFKSKSSTTEVGVLVDYKASAFYDGAGLPFGNYDNCILFAKETVTNQGNGSAAGLANTEWSLYKFSSAVSDNVYSVIQLNETYIYYTTASSNDTVTRKLDAKNFVSWGGLTPPSVTYTSSITNGTYTNLYQGNISGEYSANYIFYAFASDNGGRFATKASEAGVVSYVKNSAIYISSEVISGQGDFQATTRAYYKVSLIYDGYQESPLSNVIASEDVTTAGDSIQLTIKVFTPTTLISKRVKSLNLYRADTPSLTGDAPTGFYRLVNTFDLDTTWTPATDTNWGANYVIQYLDTGNIGQSYDAINGISETLQDTMVNYEISTQLNSEHFVGICYHPEIDDAKRYIFKSKPFCFDQFDWSQDFCILPRQPIAIASFNGRIFAFDENTTWRINPQGMYIEDTYDGVGCIGKNAVTVTEFGMFYADKNGLYMHDGSKPNNIGYVIEFGNTTSWQSLYLSDKSVIVKYDSKRKTVCFFAKTSVAGYQICWAYNIVKGRWDMWIVSSTLEYFIIGAFLGKNGEIFYSDNTDIKEFLSTSATRRNWVYETKKLGLNSPNIYKKWYKAILTSNTSGTLSLAHEYDSAGSYTSDTISGNEANLSKARQKVAKFKLSGTGNREVDAFSVVFRDYIGLSQTQ